MVSGIGPKLLIAITPDMKCVLQTQGHRHTIYPLRALEGFLLPRAQVKAVKRLKGKNIEISPDECYVASRSMFCARDSRLFPTQYSTNWCLRISLDMMSQVTDERSRRYKFLCIYRARSAGLRSGVGVVCGSLVMQLRLCCLCFSFGHIPIASRMGERTIFPRWYYSHRRHIKAHRIHLANHFTGLHTTGRQDNRKRTNNATHSTANIER